MKPVNFDQAWALTLSVKPSGPIGGRVAGGGAGRVGSGRVGRAAHDDHPGHAVLRRGGHGCGTGPAIDLLHAQATDEFGDEVAAGRIPSVRVIRARLHVGQPRAQRVQAYLAKCTH
jgi:hypothetical protein